jgi:hypothetical protein
MSVPEVRACSLWQFAAAVKGWSRANGGEKAEPPSGDDFEAAVARAMEAG